MTKYLKYIKTIIRVILMGTGAAIVIKSNPNTTAGIISMWGGWFTTLFGLYWMYEQKDELTDEPT